MFALTIVVVFIWMIFIYDLVKGAMKRDSLQHEAG